jgi:hypothetical protein
VTAAVKERTWDLATLLRRTKHNLASLARDAGVERGVLHRFENAGMSADEAEELCEAIGTDPGMVWDDWTGSAPAGNGKAPTGTPPPLVWEDPPRGGQKPTFELDQAVTAALKDRSGQWARVSTFEGRTVGNSRAGKLRKDPANAGFEFRAGKVGDGSGLWARWVGES